MGNHHLYSDIPLPRSGGRVVAVRGPMSIRVHTPQCAAPPARARDLSLRHPHDCRYSPRPRRPPRLSSSAPSSCSAPLCRRLRTLSAPSCTPRAARMWTTELGSYPTDVATSVVVTPFIVMVPTRFRIIPGLPRRTRRHSFWTLRSGPGGRSVQGQPRPPSPSQASSSRTSRWRSRRWFRPGRPS